MPARASAAGEGMTTHITVVDRDRNLVSLTSTLGMTFGSAVVIDGTGICLNNGTCWFDPEPGSVTSIGPGKRILSAASPVLVSRGGRPWLALGSPGGRRVISAVYQCLVNAIDFGLGMQAAISAPRVHAEGPDTLISDRFAGPGHRRPALDRARRDGVRGRSRRRPVRPTERHHGRRSERRGSRRRLSVHAGHGRRYLTRTYDVGLALAHRARHR